MTGFSLQSGLGLSDFFATLRKILPQGLLSETQETYSFYLLSVLSETLCALCV
jgi:hypothetical protein